MGADAPAVLREGARAAVVSLTVCERVLFVPSLNNLRYIFIVQRLSIVSKSDSNNPYRIWAELYFLNLNYFTKLDAHTKLDIWPIRPYRHPRRSQFAS
jgi:hypothetical protein